MTPSPQPSPPQGGGRRGQTGLLFLSLLLVGGLFLACGGGATPDEGAEAPFEVLDAALVEQAESLRRQALEGDGAYEFLRDLTTQVGQRFAGTEGDRRGVEWAVRRLEAMGLENVRSEEVMVPRWVRGHAVVEILAPYPQPLVAVALGGSVGTDGRALEAEVVKTPNLDALAELGRSRLEGRIVFIDQRMPKRNEGSGYGETVGIRSQGAAEAAKHGAVAVVIRSVGTSDDRLAHTGTMRYEDGVPEIPAVAVSHPDADLLAEQLKGDEPVYLRLDLGSHRLDDVPSANVVGEVVGRERPEEVVLLAAHLDSWDLGTGAIDDGAGCAIVSEVARLLASLPEAPRRTVRVLLTANEEFGLSGARAYAERYLWDLEGHVAAFESDLGADRVLVMRSRVAEEALPAIEELARLLAPLGVEYQGNEARGGADLIPLREHRVPMFDLPQDATRYFDYHHTANDTFDKVDPEQLVQNVAAYTVVAWIAAEYEPGFGRAPDASGSARGGF